MSEIPTTPAAPKAQSVTREGEPDGFQPADAFAPQVLEGGYTRLLISCDAAALPAVHRDLVLALEPPLKLLYVQLTDREVGQLPKPRQLVGVDLEQGTVLATLRELEALIYRDGRHQLWLRGAAGEQIVLEELGVIYAYPDDPSFRDVCSRHGLVEDPQAQTMADRDFVRVSFLPEADAEEAKLVWTLGLREWAG